MQAGVRFERCAPEAVGIRSEAVAKFLDGVAAEGLELHSLMLLRHGKVAAEGWWHPYRQEDVHLLYSLSKSFTSAAVGFAVSEGRFGLDDRVLGFFRDEAPAEPSENLRAMRVRDLLTMSSGQDEDNFLSLRTGDSGIRSFLSRTVPHRPGTHFHYNNGATYALSAILHRVTGESLLEYLRPRLLDPLGIEQATWATDARGIQLGATGLSVTTESIAKFGQLYLQNGRIGGRQVLPDGWVEEATRGHVSNATNTEPDWRQGYGFQFWRCRHGAYRGDGAFGQNCVVMPAQNAVFVTTAGADRLQPILDLLWHHLLPAMTDEALPEDGEAEARLGEKLSRLVLAAPEGESHSPAEKRWSGRHFASADAAFEFEFGADAAEVELTIGSRRHRIVAGLDGWRYGVTEFDADEETRIAAQGRWTSDDTFVLRIQYVLTPAHTTLTCRFGDDRVRIHLSRGGTFLPADGPEWEAFG